MLAALAGGLCVVLVFSTMDSFPRRVLVSGLLTKQSVELDMSVCPSSTGPKSTLHARAWMGSVC